MLLSLLKLEDARSLISRYCLSDRDRYSLEILSLQYAQLFACSSLSRALVVYISCRYLSMSPHILVSVLILKLSSPNLPCHCMIAWHTGTILKVRPQRPPKPVYHLSATFHGQPLTLRKLQVVDLRIVRLHPDHLTERQCDHQGHHITENCFTVCCVSRPSSLPSSSGARHCSAPPPRSSSCMPWPRRSYSSLGTCFPMASSPASGSARGQQAPASWSS